MKPSVSRGSPLESGPDQPGKADDAVDGQRRARACSDELAVLRTRDAVAGDGWISMPRSSSSAAHAPRDAAGPNSCERRLLGCARATARTCARPRSARCERGHERELVERQRPGGARRDGERDALDAAASSRSRRSARKRPGVPRALNGHAAGDRRHRSGARSRRAAGRTEGSRPSQVTIRCAAASTDWIPAMCTRGAVVGGDPHDVVATWPRRGRTARPPRAAGTRTPASGVTSSSSTRSPRAVQRHHRLERRHSAACDHHSRSFPRHLSPGSSSASQSSSGNTTRSATGIH